MSDYVLELLAQAPLVAAMWLILRGEIAALERRLSRLETTHEST